jgi:hypothetical protein
MTQMTGSGRAVCRAVVCVFLVSAVGIVQAGVEPDEAHSLYMPVNPGLGPGNPPVTGGGTQFLISGVPGYAWHHGCGPTAAGMVIGYYDTHGFGKLIPGDASTQTAAVDTAIASSEHYNDYSLPIDSKPNLLPDLSELPAGDEHADNCLADFMQTSFSARGNYYGWSYMSDVDDALEDYTAWSNLTYGASYVADSTSDYGLTWAEFTAEMDANRPMVLLVDTNGDGGTDHFVTAIGYRENEGDREYACLDTWSPVDQVRWETFRDLGEGAWGISGGTYYSITPEPATLALLGLGGLGLAARRKRR